MTSILVRINIRIIDELRKEFGDKIQREFGFKPRDSDLVKIMYHHWKGKEVNVSYDKESKCFIINAD